MLGGLRQLLHPLCQNDARAGDRIIGKDDLTKADADADRGSDFIRQRCPMSPAS